MPYKGVETFFSYDVNGRLTLSSGVPVTTSNVTAATVVYFTPYKGNRTALWNGERWVPYYFTELSLPLTDYAANTNFDIWMYNNSGVLALDSTAWSSGTARATELTTKDGVYCKDGDLARRYLGTIRTTATIGQCEDSDTKRYCWNYYNRVSKHILFGVTSTHSYATGAWRPWNNDTANRVSYVVGVTEDTIYIEVSSRSRESALVGVSLDNTSSPISYTYVRSDGVWTEAASGIRGYTAAAGYHYLQLLEYAVGAGADFEVAAIKAYLN